MNQITPKNGYLLVKPWKKKAEVGGLVLLTKEDSSDDTVFSTAEIIATSSDEYEEGDIVAFVPFNIVEVNVGTQTLPDIKYFIPQDKVIAKL